MSLKIAIVGLPNVGKSTLFNALTGSRGAQAQNYPFCTIDPNVGIVEVPDQRLYKLAETSGSQKVIPAAIEFVDVAGLVEGASKGEGLGNKFLANIRECKAIGHVIRVFDDPNVIHVNGKIDPKKDKEIIESELILADLQTLEKRHQKALSESKSGDKSKKAYAELLDKVIQSLSAGKLAIDLDLSEEETEMLTDLHLLTIKPNIYIINVPEEHLETFDKAKYAEILEISDQEKIIPICAKLEQELIELSAPEAKEYLQSVGVSDTGFSSLIHAANRTLGLINYFTSGPKESRAWTIKKGFKAPQAAGVIHTDFEKGFIKAEVIAWKDFVECGGEQKAKEKGLMSLEGKDYVVRDGDTILFKFS